MTISNKKDKLLCDICVSIEPETEVELPFGFGFNTDTMFIDYSKIYHAPKECGLQDPKED